MNLVTIPERLPVRDSVTDFSGLSLLEKTTERELSKSLNMSERYYPFLASGGSAIKLSQYGGKCMGLHMKDKLCVVIESGEGGLCRLYYGEAETPLVLSGGEKQLVSMGTKIIIYPDKAYYDTYSGEYGSLEACFESAEGVSVSFKATNAAGEELTADYCPTAPKSPKDGAYWCDTSKTPSVMKVYSEAQGAWTSMESVYVRIETPGIGAAFNKGDGVEIKGVSDGAVDGIYVLTEKGEDYIVVPAYLTGVFTQSEPVKVSRRAPAADFVAECGNRLWACRFGLNNKGVFVNEIYASKLGDPFNWQVYEGISTDSYTASLGTDGAFTAAVSYLGNVCFFKENTLHKVFGTRPSNFQITNNTILGVEQGSPKGVCIMNGMLYYKSREGITAYDGALTYRVSEKLGEKAMSRAVLGTGTRCIYLSFENEKGEWELYSYNPRHGIWHGIEGREISFFENVRGFPVFAWGKELWAIEVETGKTAELCELFGCEHKKTEPEGWLFETGELALQNGRNCYVKRVHLKMKLMRGSTVRIRASFDGAEPVCIGSLTAPIERIFQIPVVAGRCSSLKIEVSGKGDAILYSVARSLEEAPDDLGGIL